MASSAFKSTTRRSAGTVGAGDAASCTRDPARHRRPRRLSGAPPPGELLPTPAPQTRGRLASAESGSGALEGRSDELADELFPVKDWEEELERRRDWGRGRSARRFSGFAMETESSRRRGRSASRKSGDSGSTGSKGLSGVGRRRSVSAARRHVVGETESQSSSLTDDETCSVNTTKRRHEKIIRAVNAEKSDHPVVDGEVSGLYQAVRKEVRDAVDDIRIELEKVMLNTKPSMIPNGADVIAEIERSYASELEESEKCKQKLQAELTAEEYCEEELTMIVEGLFPEAEKNTKQETQSRTSNEKTWISDQLFEEAEKCFEDFISNAEDTYISSFDDEKSDACSSVGGSIRLEECLFDPTFLETQEHLAEDDPTAENDGIVLPWLQWEAEYDSSPLSNKERVMTLTPENNLNNTLQEGTIMRDNSVSPSRYTNSCGNSNGIHGNKNDGQTEGTTNFMCGDQSVNRSRCDSFDTSEYTVRQRDEDLLLEMHKQRKRVDAGSLVFCRRPIGSYLF